MEQLEKDAIEGLLKLRLNEEPIVQKNIILIQSITKRNCQLCTKKTNSDLFKMPCCGKKMCKECLNLRVLEIKFSKAFCPYCNSVMELEIEE